MGIFGNSKQDSNNQAYASGFKAGKEGNLLTDMAHGFARGIGTSSETKCNDKGYDEGSRRRHDD